jgi:hypothetical protein
VNSDAAIAGVQQAIDHLNLTVGKVGELVHDALAAPTHPLARPPLGCTLAERALCEAAVLFVRTWAKGKGAHQIVFADGTPRDQLDDLHTALNAITTNGWNVQKERGLV